MKILVIGGAGFIGSNLLKRLDADVFDKLQGDIRDPALDVSAYDTIYHLAAVSSPRESEADRKQTWDINVNGTLNLLEKMHEGQRIVFASSAQVYDRSKGQNHKESELPMPRNLYGLTKLIGEQMIEYYSKAKGLDHAILRFFNVYGPGQRTGFLMPDVIQKYTRPTVEVANPKSTIDLVYIDDIVDALVRAQKANGLFNVGTGKATKILDAYHLVKKATGSSAMEILIPDSPGQAPYKLVADISRTKKSLGWKPKVALSEGIRRTVAAAAEGK